LNYTIGRGKRSARVKIYKCNVKQNFSFNQELDDDCKIRCHENQNNKEKALFVLIPF
jgi:hypothetical protein